MSGDEEIEQMFGNLKEMLKFFQKIYGRKKGIEHYNKYWENVKEIKESDPIGACIILSELTKKGGVKYV